MYLRHVRGDPSHDGIVKLPSSLVMLGAENQLKGKRKGLAKVQPPSLREDNLQDEGRALELALRYHVAGAQW